MRIGSQGKIFATMGLLQTSWIFLASKLKLVYWTCHNFFLLHVYIYCTTVGHRCINPLFYGGGGGGLKISFESTYNLILNVNHAIRYLFYLLMSNVLFSSMVTGRQWISSKIVRFYWKYFILTRKVLFFSMMKQCKKVGEGVYGEVFRTKRGKNSVALKVNIWLYTSAYIIYMYICTITC